MNQVIIAIDGFSSTGKSTLAKQLANYFNYIYVDTGAMYRTVTYFAIKNDIIDKNGDIDKTSLLGKLPQLSIKFIFNDSAKSLETFMNGVNVENKIRSLSVSEHVSHISEIEDVRDFLVKQQREIGKKGGVVLDGRDIGTVVFPKAEVKIFMTASGEIRAKRRWEELKKKGYNNTYEEVLNNLLKRDKIDADRTHSPLKKAKDAIEIDTSFLSKKKQLQMAITLVKKTINKL